MKKSKIKLSTIKQVLHYVRNYKLLLFLSILFATITVALSLYIPIIIGNAIDLLANGQGQIDLDSVLILLGNIGIIAVMLFCSGRKMFAFSLARQDERAHMQGASGDRAQSKPHFAREPPFQGKKTESPRTGHLFCLYQIMGVTPS